MRPIDVDIHGIPLGGERYSKSLDYLDIGKIEHSIIHLNIGNQKRFLLVNSFTEDEWEGEWGETFRNQYPGLAKRVKKIEKNGEIKYKLIIGQGNFGFVRLAREIDTEDNPTEYVIVKKTRRDPKSKDVTAKEEEKKIKMARAEYRFQENFLNHNDSLKDTYVRMHAGAETRNKAGHRVVYHFMEIADLGDGDSLIKFMHPTSGTPQTETDKDGNSTYLHQKDVPLDPKIKQQLFLHIMQQTINSLKKLHAAGIYHRDVKPNNFLNFSNGSIKLSDFGAAFDIASGIQVSIQSDKAYWPPEFFYEQNMLTEDAIEKMLPHDEQGNVNYQVDFAKSDAWALGISLLQFYYGVSRDLFGNNQLNITILNPPDGNLLANYFLKLKNHTPLDYKELSELIEKIPDAGIKDIISGLLVSEDKRISLESAYQKLQKEIEKHPDFATDVRTIYQQMLAKAGGRLPSPPPPKAPLLEGDMIIEKALGEGNCAFHAFILGISEPDILQQIEQEQQRTGKNPDNTFAKFINAAAEILNVEKTWEAVKDKMIALRNQSQESKEGLEISLAQVMRDLAITLAREDKQNLERTRASLTSAFRDHVYNQLGIPVGGVGDDIYSKHDKLFAEGYKDVIKGINLDEYKNLKDKNNPTDEEVTKLKRLDEQLNTAIWQWWAFSKKDASGRDIKSGYEQFLDNMRLDGKWAGDLELKQLGRFFNVGLVVRRGNFSHDIHLEYGKLSKQNNVPESEKYDLNADTIKELISRHIIDKPEGAENEFQLLPIPNFEELTSRLGEVPDFDQVRSYLEQHDDLIIVPEGFSATCISELKKRDVIEQTNAGLLFKVNREVALKRIAAIKDADNIAKVWQKKYKASPPTITLSNERGLHWDNMRSTVKPVEAKEIPQVEFAGDAKLKEILTELVKMPDIDLELPKYHSLKGIIARVHDTKSNLSADEFNEAFKEEFENDYHKKSLLSKLFTRKKGNEVEYVTQVTNLMHSLSDWYQNIASEWGKINNGLLEADNLVPLMIYLSPTDPDLLAKAFQKLSQFSNQKTYSMIYSGEEDAAGYCGYVTSCLEAAITDKKNMVQNKEDISTIIINNAQKRFVHAYAKKRDLTVKTSKLENIVNEFLQTEKIFHEQINKFLKRFLNTKGELRKDADFLESGHKLTPVQCDTLKKYLLVYKKLSEDPFAGWQLTDSLDEKLQRIANVMVEKDPNTGLDSKYTAMMHAITECALLNVNGKFTALLDEIDETCDKGKTNFKLIENQLPGAFIILPIQRAPRIMLLLQDAKKRLDDFPDDKKAILDQPNELILRQLTELNTKTGEQERVEKVLEPLNKYIAKKAKGLDTTRKDALAVVKTKFEEFILKDNDEEGALDYLRREINKPNTEIRKHHPFSKKSKGEDTTAITLLKELDIRTQLTIIDERMAAEHQPYQVDLQKLTMPESRKIIDNNPELKKYFSQLQQRSADISQAAPVTDIEEVIKKLETYLSTPPEQRNGDLPALIHEFDNERTTPGTIKFLQSHADIQDKISHLQTDIIVIYAATLTKIADDEFEKLNINDVVHTDIEILAKDLAVTSSNLSESIGWHVLHEPDAAIRTQLIERYIFVADRLSKMGNFFSAQAVYDGLNMDLIHQVFRTDDGEYGLSEQATKTLQALRKLYASELKNDQVLEAHANQFIGKKLPNLNIMMRRIAQEQNNLGNVVATYKECYQPFGDNIEPNKIDTSIDPTKNPVVAEYLQILNRYQTLSPATNMSQKVTQEVNKITRSLDKLSKKYVAKSREEAKQEFSQRFPTYKHLLEYQQTLESRPQNDEVTQNRLAELNIVTSRLLNMYMANKPEEMRKFLDEQMRTNEKLKAHRGKVREFTHKDTTVVRLMRSVYDEIKIPKPTVEPKNETAFGQAQGGAALQKKKATTTSIPKPHIATKLDHEMSALMLSTEHKAIRDKVAKEFDNYIALMSHYQNTIPRAAHSKSGIEELKKLIESYSLVCKQLEIYSNYIPIKKGEEGKVQEAKDYLKIASDIVDKYSAVIAPIGIAFHSEQKEIFEIGKNGVTAVNLGDKSMDKVREFLGAPAGTDLQPNGVQRLHTDQPSTPVFDARVNCVEFEDTKMVSRQIEKDSIPTSEFYFHDAHFKPSRMHGGFLYDFPDERLLKWARIEVRNFVDNVTAKDKARGMDITGNLSKEHVEALMLACVHERIPCYNMTGLTVKLSDRQIKHIGEQFKKIDAYLTGKKEAMKKMMTPEEIEKQQEKVKERTKNMNENIKPESGHH